MEKNTVLQQQENPLSIRKIKWWFKNPGMDRICRSTGTTCKNSKICMASSMAHLDERARPSKQVWRLLQAHLHISKSHWISRIPRRIWKICSLSWQPMPMVPSSAHDSPPQRLAQQQLRWQNIELHHRSTCTR